MLAHPAEIRTTEYLPDIGPARGHGRRPEKESHAEVHIQRGKPMRKMKDWCDKTSKYYCKGRPAIQFQINTLVWDEREVRAAVKKALEKKEKKHETR
jgi:hypothetical protein